MADKFYYGGQAVIEGVMMRGRTSTVTAVRRTDGEIVTEALPLNPLYTGKLRKVPFIRGVVALIESMILGIKTLVFSANVALQETGENAVQLSGVKLWLLLLVSLSITVGLFFLTPLLIANLMTAVQEMSPIVFNLLEGAVRLLIFIGYLVSISRMPDIKRLFAYHGAEHKTINALEAGVPLEVDSVRKFSTAHIRCGTSFLFSVMVISFLVFSIIGRPAFLLMLATRLVLIPVIAGISYEVTFFGARHCNNPIVRAILTPGLLMQKLTTRPPDDRQLEVAIAALKQVMLIDVPVPVTESAPSVPAALIPNTATSKDI